MYSLIAVGLNLQYGVTRILNVAHGDFLMLGAYITCLTFVFYGVNPLVSLLISGPIVFVFGVLIQIVVFRRMISESKFAEELEARSLLACFGLMFIIENLVAVTVSATSLRAPFLDVPANILGKTFGLNMVVIAVASIIISLIMYLLLRFTRIGLAMRATVEDPAGAQLVGVNTLRVHAISFGLGALLAALAGSMLAMIYSITPFIGPQFTFIALAVIVLGGMGSFIGSLLGGFVVGYIYYFALMIDPLIQVVLVYSSIIIMLIIRPKGFFGR